MTTPLGGLLCFCHSTRRGRESRHPRIRPSFAHSRSLKVHITPGVLCIDLVLDLYFFSPLGEVL